MEMGIKMSTVQRTRMGIDTEEWEGMELKNSFM